MDERVEQRRMNATNTSKQTHPKKTLNPSMELDPDTRRSEKKNFSLILSDTGEYSKYFPMCLFPFSDHESNVAYIVETQPAHWDAVVTFNFASMVKPLESIHDIKSKLPGKELADKLVDHFFRCIHPYVPIIDQEEFFLKYNDFWQHHAKYRDMNAMLLMTAVYFCSAQSLQLVAVFEQAKRGVDPEYDYQKLKHQYFQCIKSINYLLHTNYVPSLSSLIALTLIYYIGSFNCVTITPELAQLVRYSQLVGLHRNISHNAQSTPIRDVAYSYIWYLDSLNSYYTGLAPLIHKDYSETINNFPKYSRDLNTLFTLVRLHNAAVSSEILSEINKINVSEQEVLTRVNFRFSECLEIVNGLNREILATPNMEPDYLRWLTAEGRLGLWRSALLVNVLRGYIDVTNNELGTIKTLSEELVLYSMLLINESIMKAVLGFKTQIGSLWFTRCSYPNQAMYIVLSHIKNYPSVELNFSSLSPQLEYTKHKEINYLEHDLRRTLINKGIEAMQSLKPLWTTRYQNRFDRVLEFKEENFGKGEILPYSGEPDLDFNSDFVEQMTKMYSYNIQKSLDESNLMY